MLNTNSKENKLIHTAVYLEKYDYEAIKALSKQDDRTVSSYIRLLIKDYLQRKQNGR